MFNRSFFTCAVHSLINLIFPSSCTLCKVPLQNETVPFFCRNCWESLVPITGPCCSKCGIPFPSTVTLIRSPTHVCGSCHRRSPAFNRAWSVFSYRSPIKEAIGLFKYRGKLSLANPLGRVFVKYLPALPVVDTLMPVPLHPQRLQEREFNQSAWLAHCLSRHLKIPLIQGELIRNRPTVPQTSLSQKDRLTNLRGAFTVRHPDKILGKSILLIDDVMTTGTTLHECAKTLRKTGSGPVYGLTLARMA